MISGMMKIVSVVVLSTMMVSGDVFGMKATGKKWVHTIKQVKNKQIKKNTKKKADSDIQKEVSKLVDVHVTDETPIKLIESLELIFKYFNDNDDNEENLHALAYNLADALKQRKINVNVKGKRIKTTPLHIAVRKSASDDGFGLYLVMALYWAGAKKDIIDGENRTALNLAIRPETRAILEDKDSKKNKTRKSVK